jgi:hypothetical protein
MCRREPRHDPHTERNYVACDTFMLDTITRLFSAAELFPEPHDAYLKHHSFNNLYWDVENFVIENYAGSHSGCTRGNAGGEGAETPLYGPYAYCRFHGTREDCQGPEAHEECDFLPTLSVEIWRMYHDCKGLSLSDFPSHRGKI